MKENFENELASGAGPNYTNKLEEKMLEKADEEKDKEEQKQEPNKPDIVDAQAQIQESAAASPSTTEAKVTLKYSVRAHFDSVRGVHYLQQHNILATISEECQIKLWNIQNIQKQFESANGFLEPYITLRGHTGAVLSITGPKIQGDANSAFNKSVSKLIFTAGVDG